MYKFALKQTGKIIELLHEQDTERKAMNTAKCAEIHANLMDIAAGLHGELQREVYEREALDAFINKLKEADATS